MYTQGVLSSRGKNVLMVDADGATRIADLAKLEAELQATEKVSHAFPFPPREY